MIKVEVEAGGRMWKSLFGDVKKPTPMWILDRLKCWKDYKDSITSLTKTMSQTQTQTHSHYRFNVLGVIRKFSMRSFFVHYRLIVLFCKDKSYGYGVSKPKA